MRPRTPERAALDPSSAKYVNAYLVRLQRGFRNALENAHRKGQLNPDTNIDGLLAHFVNAVVGISVLLRAKASPELMYAASRGIVSPWEGTGN